MEITERQRQILFAIIESYAEVAAPVGSVTLAKLFDVSSATIRAEMARLEALGLIEQPHTSAKMLGAGTIAPNRNVHALEVRINSQERTDYAIRSAVDMLAELTGNLGLGTIGEQLYLSGISRLFAQPEFLDNSKIQDVAKLLDNLEPWLREARPGEPLNIFIGHENPIGKSSGVSLIISKFVSPYSDNSYIGVLGPTRQNYAETMSLVRHAGIILENTL